MTEENANTDATELEETPDDENTQPIDPTDALIDSVVETAKRYSGNRAKIEAKIAKLVAELDALDEPNDEEIRSFCNEAIVPVADALGEAATLEVVWPIVATRFDFPAKIRKARASATDADSGDGGDGGGEAKPKVDGDTLEAKILECLDYEGMTSKQVFAVVSEQLEGVERPNLLRILKKLVSDGKVAREGERARALFSLTS